MGLIRAAALFLLLAAPAGAAETLRVATWSPDLTRKGPGLLLRDIQSGKDEQIAAAVQVIAAADADLLLLTGFDWDHHGAALTAFAALLEQARGSLGKLDAVLVEAQGVASNAREATTDLGPLRADVESSLRKIDGLIDEINRKWPFARDTEIKLP